MKHFRLKLFFTALSLFLLSGLLLMSVLFQNPIRESLTVEAGTELKKEDFYKNKGLLAFFEKYKIPLFTTKVLTDLETIPYDRVGEFPVQFLANGKTVTSFLKIEDTEKPDLIEKDAVIPAGSAIIGEDFIEELRDATEVRVKAHGLSAYKKGKKSGVYRIRLEAVDNGGNKSVKQVKLYALNLKKKATAELGEKDFPAENFLTEPQRRGLHIEYRKGFDVSPCLVYEGSYTVPLTVSVKGAKKEIDLQLVVKDSLAPKILGIRDFDIYMGSPFSYRNGVYVTDNGKETTEFEVDAKRVNIKKPGSYPVYYEAEDTAGNRTREKISVTVKKADKAHGKEVRKFAKETLSEITDENMTSLQKLKKIYDFCGEIRYTGNSDKRNVAEAAYQGFRTRTGDCFTYYAVAKALLLEAGFQEMMITREGGKAEHYWNLVKYEGEWYHFDSCPREEGGSFLPFMCSDRDMKEFSETYGEKYPAHEGYYRFRSELYPKRAKKSVGR